MCGFETWRGTCTRQQQSSPLAQLIRIGGVGEPAARGSVRHRFLHTLDRAWLVDDFHAAPSSFLRMVGEFFSYSFLLQTTAVLVGVRRWMHQDKIGTRSHTSIHVYDGQQGRAGTYYFFVGPRAARSTRTQLSINPTFEYATGLCMRRVTTLFTRTGTK